MLEEENPTEKKQQKQSFVSSFRLGDGRDLVFQLLQLTRASGTQAAIQIWTWGGDFFLPMPKQSKPDSLQGQAEETPGWYLAAKCKES